MRSIPIPTTLHSTAATLDAVAMYVAVEDLWNRGPRQLGVMAKVIRQIDGLQYGLSALVSAPLDPILVMAVSLISNNGGVSAS